MCIPLLFTKGKIPKKLPLEMQKEVNKLKKTKSKLECLKQAYNFIKKNFKSKRHQTVIKFFRLFVTDVNKLWDYTKKDKFLHCTQQNYMLRVLLIKSNKFKEQDIGVIDGIHTGFGIHQYLIVNVGNKWMDIDVWFSNLGIGFGRKKPVLFRIWPKIF